MGHLGRFDSRMVVKCLILLNLLFFTYQIFSVQSYTNGSQNPCIVVMNTSTFKSPSNVPAVPEPSKLENAAPAPVAPALPHDKLVDRPPEVPVAVPVDSAVENVESAIAKADADSKIVDVPADKMAEIKEPINPEQLQYEQAQVMRSNVMSRKKDDPKQYWWTDEVRTGFQVLNNYVISDRQILQPDIVKQEANISITYTTQASYEFLGHADQLCQRFDGPVSIAVYAPGTEFVLALSLIYHLRECGHPCVKRNVSWHMVYNLNLKPDAFDVNRFPDEYLIDNNVNMIFDCSVKFKEYASNLINMTFTPPKNKGQILHVRAQKHLPYPINVLRNVARLSSTTKYVLASDIELYPSIHITEMFRKLLQREKENKQALINPSHPHVYILPIFEVKATVDVPRTKTQLATMLTSGDAIPFHKWVCNACQNFVDRDKWIKETKSPDDMNIFRRTKRSHTYWEPIYIGTNAEPLYEERLSWDGKRDKMSQMLEMCLIDYDLLILDNAFLCHAPGIKHIDPHDNQKRLPFIKTNSAIYNSVVSSLHKKYKTNPGC